MCADALVHARIKSLYFTTLAPKAGACGSTFQLIDNDILNHKLNFSEGMLKEAILHR